MRARNETRNPELLRPAHHGTARISRRRLLGASGLGALGLAAAALIGCGDAGDDEARATAPNAGSVRRLRLRQRDALLAPHRPLRDSSPRLRLAPARRTPQAAAPSTAFPDELVIANEIEARDLFPWLSGFGQMLVTRQVYETLVEPRLTLAADGRGRARRVLGATAGRPRLGLPAPPGRELPQRRALDRRGGDRLLRTPPSTR